MTKGDSDDVGAKAEEAGVPTLEVFSSAPSSNNKNHNNNNNHALGAKDGSGSPGSPTSTYDTDDDSDADFESGASGEYDGHRPTRREISRSASRRTRCSSVSRPVSTTTAASRQRRGPAAAAAGAVAGAAAATATPSDGGSIGLRRTASRTQTVLSRIRSRPTAEYRFTHALSHVATTAEHLVDFDGPDDPYRPANWPTRKKAVTTMLYGLCTLSTSWASSSLSPGTAQVARHFGVGDQVAVLGTSLFLAGLGVGPLLWAPLSEIFGRRLAVLPPVFVGMLFSFAAATAKDLQTLLLARFFGAFFSSAPVTNTGGVLGDLYSPEWRAIAMAGYTLAVVGGPTIGPIVSAALVVQPSLGWRWTEYLTGILQGVILLVCVIFIDETYPPRLLVYKARRLRHETGNWALHAKFEEWDVGFSELSRKFLVRPMQLLGTPICLLMALYASFCYGMLYIQLGAVPFIFGDIRGWPLLPATLPMLCTLIGVVLGLAANCLNQASYNRAYRAAGDRAVPEKRLPPMMAGSLFFAAGQFLTGWTADARFHWTAPGAGIVLQGIGFIMIFQAALNYLVDTFQMYAASAIGANTFLRSAFACAFPLVVTPLYRNLGVGPGASITGGFAVLLIPVPFVFYVYGKRIRAGSKWSKASVYN